MCSLRILKILLMLVLLGLSPIICTAAISEVTIDENGFNPQNITINKGDTVKWTNKGTSFHSATSGSNGVADGSFDSGLLNPGVSFEQVFSLQGVAQYFDRSDSAKAGTVTIEDNEVVVSPGNDSLLFTSQGFDLVIYAKLKNPMRKVVILFDGVDITQALGQLAIFESTKTFDASMIRITIPPFILPSGVHTLQVTITTNSGLTASAKAGYTVLEAIPAPGPPPFGWPCVEPLLICK